MIRFDCPMCRAKYQVKDEFAGRSVRCKHCGHALSIPSPAVEAAEPAAVSAASPSEWSPPAAGGTGESLGGAPSAESAGQAEAGAAVPAEVVPAVSAVSRRALVLGGAIGGGVLAAATLGVVLWLTVFKGGGQPGDAPKSPKDTRVVIAPVTNRELAMMVNQANRNAEKIKLTVQFVPGDYRMTETDDTAMTLSLGDSGQTMDIKQKMSIGGDVQISPPAADGEQTVRMVVRQMGMTMSASGRRMDFDSDQPASRDSELGRAIRPLVGLDVTLRCRDGKFTNVPETLELITGRMSAAGSLPPEAVKQMGKMMGPFLKEMLTQHWGELIPSDPIGVGDGWTKAIAIENFPAIGPTALDAECALVDIEDGPNNGKVAVLAFTLSTTLRNRDIDLAEIGGGAPPGAKATIDSMTIRMSGKGKFDNGVGLATFATIDGKVEGEMTVTDGREKMTFRIKANVTQTSRLDKVR